MSLYNCPFEQSQDAGEAVRRGILRLARLGRPVGRNSYPVYVPPPGSHVPRLGHGHGAPVLQRLNVLYPSLPERRGLTHHHRPIVVPQRRGEYFGSARGLTVHEKVHGHGRVAPHPVVRVHDGPSRSIHLGGDGGLGGQEQLGRVDSRRHVSARVSPEIDRDRRAGRPSLEFGHRVRQLSRRLLAEARYTEQSDLLPPLGLERGGDDRIHLDLFPSHVEVNDLAVAVGRTASAAATDGDVDLRPDLPPALGRDHLGRGAGHVHPVRLDDDVAGTDPRPLRRTSIHRVGHDHPPRSGIQQELHSDPRAPAPRVRRQRLVLLRSQESRVRIVQRPEHIADGTVDLLLVVGTDARHLLDGLQALLLPSVLPQAVVGGVDVLTSNLPPYVRDEELLLGQRRRGRSSEGDGDGGRRTEG
mmetsp:Transcript_34595/g.103373  ORF Transcript_34595/g.103373 Transcript_34595/m.103373 type:complete len:414 (+) Transcript_34595:301-1542(+)